MLQAELLLGRGILKSGPLRGHRWDLGDPQIPELSGGKVHLCFFFFPLGRGSRACIGFSKGSLNSPRRLRITSPKKYLFAKCGFKLSLPAIVSSRGRVWVLVPATR